MANKIQLRRGLKASMPQGSAGEPLYATDTRELFIGTGSGNVNMGGSHWYSGTAMSGTSTAAGAYSYSACPDVKLDDIYMNTSNGNIYACTTAGKGSAAKWTYKGCIKGAQGIQGIQGAQGDKGDKGVSAVWHSGTAMSGTGTKSVTVTGASAGDMYLNTSTCDVYKASSASSWTWICNIKGAQGAKGDKGSDASVYGALDKLIIVGAAQGSGINKRLKLRFLTGVDAGLSKGDVVFLKTNNDFSGTISQICSDDNPNGQIISPSGDIYSVKPNSLYLCKAKPLSELYCYDLIVYFEIPIADVHDMTY